MWTLRAALPKRSPRRRAQFDTLRLRLVKIAARVVEMKTRITVHLPSACPAAPVMRLLLERLPSMAPIRRPRRPTSPPASRPQSQNPTSPRAGNRARPSAECEDAVVHEPG
jgi:hypothetical protein